VQALREDSPAVDDKDAFRILTSRQLTLALFHYRVARMVQDNVRADPSRDIEGFMLASRQRHLAADRLACLLVTLLDAADQHALDLQDDWGEVL
jgi:hypothetical protein